MKIKIKNILSIIGFTCILFFAVSCNGKSKSTSSADVCECLNDASYYNSNESKCDKVINSKLGHNWKTTNNSQEPAKSTKFDALAAKCK